MEHAQRPDSMPRFAPQREETGNPILDVDHRRGGQDAQD